LKKIVSLQKIKFNGEDIYKQQLIIKKMETVVIKTRTKSDVPFLLDLAKRIGASAKAIDTEEIEDKYLLSLIEKGLKTESVSRNEIMKVLKK